MKKKKENNKIQLSPQDRIIFSGGLKIENVSKDNFIEIAFPEGYTITPMIHKQAEVNPQSKPVVKL